MNRLPRLLACAGFACAASLFAVPRPLFAAPDDAKAPAAGNSAKPGADAKPDAAAPDTAKPDTAKPDAGNMPDAAAADSATGDTSKPAESGDTAGGEAASPKQALADMVEDFWHYGKIASYGLADAEGKKILASGADPLDVLKAFEAASGPKKDLDTWMLRWAGVDELRDTASKLIAVQNQGYAKQREDQNFIEKQIQELSTSERGYALARDRLRNSGEIAVPLMIHYLRDPSKLQYHDGVRRALRDMGRTVLNPLVATTEMKDPDPLVAIVSILGEMGYDAAVPYLARLAAAPETAPAVRDAATDALRRLGVDPRSSNPADLFYGLAEKFYYNSASITPDVRNPLAIVWYWDEAKGLVPKRVPPPIFNDVMAMRASEYAMRIDGGQGDALSLWLAANNKRELDLPKGGTDTTRPNDDPSAHYYNVQAGARYLRAVLARSLKDRNAGVALKAVQSLQNIVGRADLFGSDGGSPLLEALQYSDRLVRFEAALAIASALPQQAFPGQERVPVLLGEALSQTGKPSVLVVAGSDAERARLVGELKDGNTAGGTGVQSSIVEAKSLPSVDVIVFGKELSDADADSFLQAAGQDARLQRSAKVIVRPAGDLNWARRAIADKSIIVATSDDAGNLPKYVADARARTAGVPLDEKLAAAYALRSAQVLARLADSRGQLFDLSGVESNLLAALNDKRPEIAKAAGNVLERMDSKSAQAALLNRAADDKTPDEVKISFFKSLATSAKNFGNRLPQPEVQSLQQVALAAKNLDVRSASAEALGALNLPNEQAKKLILERSTKQ